MDEQKDDLAKVDDLEIEPLSDEALESVAGGTSGGCCTCSGDNCSSSNPPKEEVEGPIYV